MDKPSCRESAILLTDIILYVPQHGNPSLLQHDRVFVDVFATKGSKGYLEPTFQPILKIRRLGPLVHLVRDGKDIWEIDESMEIPLSMQHINLVVSTENPKHSYILGYLEKDMNGIFQIALQERTYVNQLVDSSSGRSSWRLGFKCVVMPGKELMVSTAEADRNLDGRELQMHAWLEHEVDKRLRFQKLGAFFYQRFGRVQDIHDIDMAIAYQGEVLRLTPVGHPDKPSSMNNLGKSLLTRFERLGDLNDMNQSVIMFKDAVRLTPDGHPDKPARLNNLGNSLCCRFERLGDLNDMNKSVVVFKDAVQLTPDGHPDKPSRLSNLGNSLLSRFERLGSINDMNKSISMFEEAVQLTPDGHPDKPSILNNLGISLLSRFERLGDLNDMNQSVVVKEDAVRLTPDGHPDKPSLLNNLGSSLLSRFERLGDLNDMNQSIVVKKDAVKLTPDGHPDKPSLLNNLGNSHFRCFERLGDLSDLNQSVIVFDDAVRLTPEGHPDKSSRLNSLGSSLFRRFERLGDLNDINQSIVLKKDAIRLTPDGHPDKPFLLNNLGSSLSRRFERLGDLNDMNQSVVVKKDAVRLIADGHPGKPSLLNNLGNSLFHRFERLGDLNDMNQSVVVFKDAVRLTPDGHPDKPSLLNNLGNSLFRCVERLGDLNDMNQSIIVFKDAVQLTPFNHPDKPSRLNNLGSLLLSRFERLGDLNDINQSVIMLKDAVQITPDGHPDKPARLNNLGNSLFRRFERLGDLHDLNQSVVVKEEAVRLTSDGHPDKPSRLNNLGLSFSRRFERLGDLNDMNQSVLVFDDAVRLSPDGHPDKPSLLNNLGNSLFLRFERFGDLNDMNKSIVVFEDAVRLTPDGHPGKRSLLNNLGNSLLSRFGRLGDLSDVNQSIILKEDAVRLTPDGQPDKPSFLYNLGSSLLSRFGRLGDQQDQIYSLSCYSSAALEVAGPPSVKFRASSQWGHIAQQLKDSSHFDAYSTALALLPQLAWLGSSVKDRHFYVKEAGAVVRHAAIAAIEYDDPTTAVEWLEQGCSVIWGQLLHLRLPIHDLKSSHPELGEKLLSLSSKLEGANISQQAQFSASSVSTESVDYHSVAHERDLLLNEVRQRAGFEHFLLPKPLSELTRAAQIGPVVMLNATEQRCDALILIPGLNNDVMHIPLPDTSLAGVTALHKILQHLVRGNIPTIDMLLNSSMRGLTLVFQESGSSYKERLEKVFRRVLSEIWDSIVNPIVQGLALSTNKLCRIWWCPTGPFSFLPLHAAGDYLVDAAFGSKLMDYAISSYTPSLTVLIQALDSMPTIPKAPQFLAVAQPSATGQSHIPGTLKELEFIEDQAKKHNIKIISLEGSDATVLRVKEEMRNTNWVHFACHGVQDSKNPTDSALLLSGSSRLTLSEMIGMKMPSKGLAFLSACQTATGDESLSDEAVHLAAGMLSAGYRGVLATMWSINDLHAPQVASDIYEYLFMDGKFDSTRAAEALHYAVKNLQGKDSVSPLVWVPFIHMGL